MPPSRIPETRPPSSSKKGFHSPRCPSLFLPTLFLSSSPPCFIYPLSFARSRSRYEESSFGVTRFVGREIQFYTTRCNRSNYGIKHRAVFSLSSNEILLEQCSHLSSKKSSFSRERGVEILSYEHRSYARRLWANRNILQSSHLRFSYANVTGNKCHSRCNKWKGGAMDLGYSREEDS